MQPKSTKTRNKRGWASLTDIDRQLGPKIRERRILLGLTQKQLADLIGINFQQVNKYEKGIDRVFAGRLYALTRALGVEIDYFFPAQDDQQFSQMGERQRRLLELAHNTVAISDLRQRQAVCDFTRLLVGSAPDEETGPVEKSLIVA